MEEIKLVLMFENEFGIIQLAEDNNNFVIDYPANEPPIDYCQDNSEILNPVSFYVKVKGSVVNFIAPSEYYEGLVDINFLENRRLFFIDCFSGFDNYHLKSLDESYELCKCKMKLHIYLVLEGKFCW